MTEISHNNWMSASDTALLETIGTFIKNQRLQQSKTQGQLAEEAGIVRSTLSLFERGKNTSLLVFIQLLRALKLLYMLQEFQVKQQLSPLQLAKMEQTKRLRVRSKTSDNKKKKTESTW